MRRSEPPVGRGRFRLGRILGVEIVLDWSLLIIFALIVVNLGAGFAAWHPDWSAAVQWGMALLAGVLFLGSILAHELSHAVVANRSDIPVKRITLFLFGGMAHMNKPPPSPRSEFWMAVVGPITSLVIGFVASALGLWIAGGAFAEAEQPAEAIRQLGPLATLLLWLGPINILLGVFNMVPGFPLDGGRVLRAALWWFTGDLRKATRWTSAMGQIVGLGLIAMGVAMVFGARIPILGTGLIGGLWLVLIGWFLNNAAVAGYQQLVVRQALENVTVAEVMRSRIDCVGPEENLATLVEEHLTRSDQRSFPVVHEGRLVGLVGVEQVRTVPRAAWASTPVTAVMRRADTLVTLEPADEAAEAMRRLADGTQDIPVVEDGHLRGLVQMADITRWLALRGELGAPAPGR